MTRLAVSIMVESAEAAISQAALAAERGADLVEYRLDLLAERPEECADLVERSPLPCIVTIRPTWEGGDFEGTENDRLALWERLVAGSRPPVYLDVELAAYQRSPEFARRVDQLVSGPNGDAPDSSHTALILSTHDYKTRPADLLQRIAAMAEIPSCRVIKAAWTARSLRDNLEAFELLAAAHKPTIALCMGRFGLPSRVLAGKFGAFLTFAGLDDSSVTAPGQVGVATLKELYRWDRVNPGSRVYGVIGWPVEHSMSPPIHNAGFDVVDHNGVYLPMAIPPEYEHFKATVGAWLDQPALQFRGASVTIPHKQNLLRFVKESGGRVDELADRIGAANTLRVSGTGGLYATNTDYGAALDAVCEALDVRRSGLKDRRIAVIGAGGAAAAVIAGFAYHGANVVVYNRTVEKARALAEQFSDAAADGGKVVAAPMENLCKSCCEVYINCTPLGMHPETDGTPLTDWPASVNEGTVVFDTIYNPIETRLLREARERGCRTIGGIQMFVRQAAAQFEQWTGQPAPTDVFERVVRERLSESG